MKQGLKWKIGNDQSINIWRDKWLNSVKNPFISATSSLGQENLKVRDLIDPSTDLWNYNIIETNFNQDDIQAIKATPLLYPREEDKLIWNFTTNGTYNVRFAYHCTMENILNNHHLRVAGNWTRIRKLNIPPKIKHFLWRALRGCLPTRQRLILKGVQFPHDCCFCLNYMENEWHIFIACDTAHFFWQCADLLNIIEPLANSAEGFWELIFNLLDTQPDHTMNKISIILWAI